jgi:hypothetical protein
MINSKPGRGCPDVTRETRVSRTGSALRRNVDLQGGLVHADLGALTVAGGRLLHFHPAHSPVITNQTSPHFAETLGGGAGQCTRAWLSSSERPRCRPSMIDQNREHFMGSLAGHCRPCSSAVRATSIRCCCSASSANL